MAGFVGRAVSAGGGGAADSHKGLRNVGVSGVKLQTAVADNVVYLEHQGVFDVGVIDKLPHGREKAFYNFINTVTDAGGINADVCHVILLSQFADGLCLGAGVHSAPLVTLKDAELTAGSRCSAVWRHFLSGRQKTRADLYKEMPVKVSGFKQPIADANWAITTLTRTVNPDR